MIKRKRGRKTTECEGHIERKILALILRIESSFRVKALQWLPHPLQNASFYRVSEILLQTQFWCGDKKKTQNEILFHFAQNFIVQNEITGKGQIQEYHQSYTLVQ